MHKSLICLFAITLVTAPALGQPRSSTGPGGGSQGESPSGDPLVNNPFRQQEMDQQLPPERTSDYEIALRLIQQRDYDGAIPHLEAAHAKKPNDAHVLFYLGYAHHIRGQNRDGAARDADFQAALESYRHALQLDSSLREVHQYLGTIEVQTGDTASAVMELKALKSLCPSGCPERDSLDRVAGRYDTPK